MSICFGKFEFCSTNRRKLGLKKQKPSRRDVIFCAPLRNPAAGEASQGHHSLAPPRCFDYLFRIHENSLDQWAKSRNTLV